MQERIRLARIVDQLAADRVAHLRTIQELDERLRTVNQSLAVRLAHAPRAMWRRVHRSRS